MVITCVLNDANIHLRHGQKQNPQPVCHAKTQLMSHHQENKNKQLPKFNFTYCGRCCFKNRLNQTVTCPPHFLCSWTGTEQRKSSWRLVECELLKRDWWSLCNSHMTRACTPTRSHTHTIYPLIKSLCINDKIILIASQLSEVVVGCNCPLHAWWRDASHLWNCEPRDVKPSQFLPSCDKKRGVLRADRGTDVVQVRRSAPAEATRTQNALGVRCLIKSTEWKAQL